MERPERQPFYTIGHSTRTIDEFTTLLRSVRVSLVADVRTMPRSRAAPQYNMESLAQVLGRLEVGYEHLAVLGGLRGRQRAVPREVNGFWQNESFHNYADYAMGQDFRNGIDRLRELGREQRCAIMCAEALWWRCHRRIIADYLLAGGDPVFHLVSPGHTQEASRTSAARVGPGGVLVYPLERSY